MEKAAVHYLERYSSSSENLKAVLRRKVWRAARETEIDQEQAERWIDDAVTKLQRSELLDDKAYAEMRVLSLRRSGNSARAIRMKLAAKGVDAGTVDVALAQDEPENDDLVAAVAYARRQRLGPFRDPSSRAERLQRDIASLARRGFSLQISRAIMQ